MGQALYRKYRPKSLSEVIGEEHITTTLKNAIDSSQISHSYLFTGPKGVGKTSVARILAHEINNFKYDDDINYLDIVEIDAASNRRIDEIRQLRDKVNIAPTSGKYKVYIIDEVHMLTREAFNALLKTLEEPPAHVVFILATTEAHKVPETIISRTQQFNFRPVAVSQVIKHLKYIAKQEKLTIDDDAIEIIAEYGEGSFRDSISLLDQASSISSKITLKELEILLGIAPSSIIDNIINAIENNSAGEIIKSLKNIEQAGYNITIICKQLIEKLKYLLINNKTSIVDEDLLKLMKSLLNVPLSNDSFTSLEITLLESITYEKNEIIKIPEKKINRVEEEINAEIEEVLIPPAKEIKETQILSKPRKRNEDSLIVLDEKNWKIVLDKLKVKYNTLYGIIRMAIPVFNGSNIVLKTKFDFHKRLLNDNKNQKIILDIIYEITGNEATLQSVIDKNIELDELHEKINEIEETSNTLTNINNIFGSSEVLE